MTRTKSNFDVAIDQAQEVVFRNLIFEPEIVEQRLRAGVASHHEQQSSERGYEQQHQQLWPAYNVNPASQQALSQGPFQQTRLFSTVTLGLHPETPLSG